MLNHEPACPDPRSISEYRKDDFRNPYLSRDGVSAGSSQKSPSGCMKESTRAEGDTRLKTETPQKRKKSLRKAIDENCKECIYDPLAGGSWRKQVTLCTVNKCPLYPVRPLAENAKCLLDGVRRHHQQQRNGDLCESVGE